VATRLELHPLGRSGLEVTRIGLGLAAVGRPAYINLGHGADVRGATGHAALEARAHEMLDAAYDAGLRYVDAARSYGDAEAFLASWLAARGLEPGTLTVGSKWGYTYVGGWRIDAEQHEVKDLSAATLQRQLGETRALLGPYLGLYQIHSATIESGVLDDRAVLDHLRRLRRSGVAVGLTVTGAHQAATIERALEAGLFDTVQATFNLLERSAGPALEAAHAAGLGVIVKEALANGRLTERGGIEPYLAAARERGAAPDALALAFVLAHPFVDVALSGAATAAQLHSNLQALELDAAIAAGFDGLADDPARYWDERSRLAWG
jgi:aryl-alcohol dehydrogenase-like predicted oxidoreductase